MNIYECSSLINEPFTPKYCGIGTYELRTINNLENIFFFVFRVDISTELIHFKKTTQNLTEEEMQKVNDWIAGVVYANETKLFQHLAF